jgi:hypothetical protein
MKMEEFRKVFDSIEDFVSYAAETKESAELGAWGGGCRTWDEVESLAYNGWKEGAARAERMRLEVQNRIDSLGLEGLDAVENYDVSGAFVDVGAFCEGEPECMVEYEEQMMPRQRVARIFVQINYLSDVNCDQAERRGVAIAAVVDALEAHGMQCEVWGVDYSMGGFDYEKGESDYHRHAVLVKKSGQLMPLDRLAFAIGHPSFYRGVSFAARAGISGGAWGSTRPLPKEWQEPGELVIPHMERRERQWQSDDAAMDWVAEHVTKFVEEVTK